jgi:hypothetical protein
MDAKNRLINTDTLEASLAGGSAINPRVVGPGVAGSASRIPSAQAYEPINAP